MTREFIDRVLTERTVDTAKYRYIVKAENNHALQWQEIRRIERSKLDTTEALGEWELVWCDTYLFPDDGETADRIFWDQHPVCLSPAEVRRLSGEWDTDLFSIMREATDDEIAEYGVYN